MARIGPYTVSDEKLKDILDGRARMQAWVESFRPYLPCPDGEKVPLGAQQFTSDGQIYPQKYVQNGAPNAAQPEIHPLERRLNQLEGNLISLRDALKQHVNETKKKAKSSSFD